MASTRSVAGTTYPAGARLRLLGAAARSLLLLQRSRQLQQLLVRAVEVDRLAQRLADVERRRPVELDPVVLRVVEVHAARDAVAHGAVDLHPRVLQPVMEHA